MAKTLPFPTDIEKLAAMDRRALAEPSDPEPLLAPSTPPVAAPFPLDALPATVSPFVDAVAALFPVPVSVPVAGVLATLATAIGTQRAIAPKPGWTEYPSFFLAVVAPTGSAKSAALRQCLTPLLARQRALLDKFRSAVAEWESNDPDHRPPRPRCAHTVTTDATVEALAAMLDASPRGLLLHRDELTGWLSGMDAYRASRGGDLEFWLQVFSSEPVKVDRKGGDPLMVDRPLVNVLGSLVPDNLPRFRTGEYANNGFYQRLTVIAPDWPPRRVSRAVLAPAVVKDYARVVDALFDLPPVADPETGQPATGILSLDEPADAYWWAWVEAAVAEESDLPSILQGKWPRLEATALRLAVVLHEAEQPGRTPGPVGVETIHAACQIAEWLMATERRLTALSEIDADENRDRRLRDWIAGRPGSTASAREIHQHGVGGIKKTAEARRALASLVERGWARWIKPNQSVEVEGTQ